MCSPTDMQYYYTFLSVLKNENFLCTPFLVIRFLSTGLVTTQTLDCALLPSSPVWQRLPCLKVNTAPQLGQTPN